MTTDQEALTLDERDAVPALSPLTYAHDGGWTRRSNDTACLCGRDDIMREAGCPALPVPALDALPDYLPEDSDAK